LNIIRQLQNVQNVTDPKEKLGLVASIIGGSILTTVCLIIYSAFPVVQIIVGVFNKENCQVQTMIPVWLIVMGAGSLIIAFIKIIGNIIMLIKKRSNAEAQEPVLLNCFSFCGTIFLLVWFILGNVWVYSKWNTVRYDKYLDPNNYCDKITYLLAFWSITISYVFIALACACCCCVLAIACGGLCCAAAISKK
jgi:hypothetical protein